MPLAPPNTIASGAFRTTVVGSLLTVKVEVAELARYPASPANVAASCWVPGAVWSRSVTLAFPLAPVTAVSMDDPIRNTTGLPSIGDEPLVSVAETADAGAVEARTRWSTRR